MTGSMKYRLRVGDYNSTHMTSFRNAMKQLQSIRDNRGYNHIAGFHGRPNWWCWHHQNSHGSDVQARLFLPWHRAYLWWLEQALQDINDTVALPWWDWTVQQGVPPAYDAAPSDGAANPLQEFEINFPVARNLPAINRYTNRSPGSNRFVSLPNYEDVNTTLAISDWPRFSDQLQIFHDNVHGWVGGDMGNTTYAAFDPIFYAHHCMIDRIWSLWQVKWGNGGVPNELRSMQLSPFGKTVEDVLDVQTLGYEYAAETIAIS